MKNSNTRRSFIRSLSIGVFSTVFTFCLFRPAKSSHLLKLLEPDDDHLPMINPAYKMNIFSDGRVELYTHQKGGEKVTYTFEGLEADVLRKLSERKDPRKSVQDFGSRYSMENEKCMAMIETTLESMEDQGFLYQGETMLVKVVEADNG